MAACMLCSPLILAFGASSGSYIIPVRETAVIPAEFPENTVSTAAVDPVIIKMGTAEEMKAQNAEYLDHKHSGIYEPTVLDGISCLKLSYSKPELALMPEYRFQPKFPGNKALTSAHKYMRVTFRTSDTYPSELIICNPGNLNGGYIPLMSDCSVSGGEWVRSAPVNIEGNGCLNRFLTNSHCAVGFYTTSLDAEYYISEIAFFGSMQQAYEYYGEDYREESSSYVEMNFANGSGDTYDGETYGSHQFNNGTMSLDITYAEETNIVPAGQNRWCSYLAKIKFGATAPYSSDYRYMRVLYSAKNPEGVTGASMYVWTDTGYYAVKLVDNIKDTNGEFVLSDTALVSQYAGDRWAGTGRATSRAHNSLFINTDKEGGLYSIKSIYFFNTKKAADEFTVNAVKADISINGTDISNYRVVISDEAPYHVTNAAVSLVQYIKGLTDVTLPIVTDREPASEYEILVGVSDREKSKIGYYEDILPTAADSRNVIKVDGKDVIITSELPVLLEGTAAKFMRSALYSASKNIPDSIDVKDMTETVPSASMQATKYKNKFYSNTDEAVHFTDSFDTDDGYFTEKNGADVWRIENGVLTASADERALTHMQVFEPNAVFSAKMKYRDAGDDGDIGLMLRYNADDAWVKAGYDFDKGEWYIENRMGADFYVVRNAALKATIAPDTEYELTFTVDRYNASLSVNGSEILSANDIAHTSPGMIAFFAEDVTATFDDADIVLLSGEGTILRNVYHTQLDPDKWLAGGTVIKMQDGTLRYTSRKFANLTSSDGGKSWVNADIFVDSVSEPNILRLNNGNLLMIELIDSSVISSVSEDDGKTWKRIGYVCPGVYNNDSALNAAAGNIQDRIFQSPTTGRIFFCQTFETKTSSMDGRKVFCEIYYSDNNGRTWFKSETDPWQIVGNEKAAYFGELKILECSDGSLRIYCSWNQYGCIVYSESTDNGVTWGPLVEMPEFKCSHSTMAFARDPKGETDHTYYMVWVYSVDDIKANMPRSRLSLAKTTDGKNWVYLGDLWRWESAYNAYNIGVHINHLVNPFIYVTDDAVICGTGASERISFSHHHQQQRQNIWTVMKDTLPEGKKLTTFEDVKLGTETYGAVSFAVERGLFSGISDLVFAPNSAMNRSMFVTVLGRLDGADTAKYTVPTFSDVEAGQWYTPYVEWAADNSIVNGLGGGVFGINGNITIEQACTILARYAGYADAPGKAKTSADFPDGNTISAWARDGVEWALRNGIYEGVGGKLAPTASAKRGTVAGMFANYVRIFGE